MWDMGVRGESLFLLYMLLHPLDVFPRERLQYSKWNTVRKTISVPPDTNPSYGLSLNQTPLAHHDGSYCFGHLPSARHGHSLDRQASTEPVPWSLGEEAPAEAPRSPATLTAGQEDRGSDASPSTMVTITIALVQGPLDPIRACFWASACRT